MVEIAVVREIKPDLFSRLIQFFTKAAYSHVMIIVNGSVVYHAIGRGVVKEYLTEVLDGNSVICDRFEVELSNEDYVVAYMEGSLGIRYSLFQCAAIVLRLLRPLALQGRGSMHCAEFVADVWTNAMKKPKLTSIDFLNQREVFEACRDYEKRICNANGEFRKNEGS